MTPRVRNLLRQAQKVSRSGKRLAAEQLYRQIVEEFPDAAEGWAGLGHVASEEGEKREAFERALALDPENRSARRGILLLDGLPIPAELEDSEEEAAEEIEPPSETSAPENHADHLGSFEIFDPENGPLVCYRHPDTETSLRCNRCGRPICVKCANRTSVGYRCPDCLLEIEAGYFTAAPSDYLLATIVALPLSLLAGFLITLVGGGFGIFFFFIVAAVGGAVGAFIARITHRAIGRRRGRYTPQLVAGLVAAGGILPGLLIALLSFSFFGLLMPAIYAFVAASAAYYQIR